LAIPIDCDILGVGHRPRVSSAGRISVVSTLIFLASNLSSDPLAAVFLELFVGISNLLGYLGLQELFKTLFPVS
jgi:hypothetical protein